MELRQLAHFVAVAEERSFTRAARRVHVVQSGLSATVASLERELGAMLFDRTTRSVVLTEPGLELLTYAREILEAAERTKDAVTAVAGGVRGSLRVGLMHALLAPPVAQALADFHRERPHVHLLPRTSLDGSAGLVQAVVANELDVAFAAITPNRLSGVETTVITSEEMVLICPIGHRLSGRRQVSPSELAEEAFIDVPTGWGSRTSTDNLFNDQGVQRRVEIEIGDVATVLDLVRVGLGLALIAPSSAPAIGGVVAIRMKPAPIFDVSLVLPTTRQVKPAARALADLVLERLDRNP